MPTNDTECAHWRYLDERFNTDPNSPLHHDNRCWSCHPDLAPVTR